MQIPLLRHAASITAILGLTAGLLSSSPALATQPGRGLTTDTEIAYLKFIIDHHYSALRMTELAAGTDLQRDAPITQDEGTAPTPDAAQTQAKASMPEIKSLARRNNRMQREEILKAQHFLKDWYGITYTPHLPQENLQQIQLLESMGGGKQFDHLFLEVFSRHHYTALAPSIDCIVSSDIVHDELHRYCNGVVHAQINDIQDMRQMLDQNFGIVDYQPNTGLKGQHSGED